MRKISLADVKARLSEVVAEVEKGQVVQITRRGRPVVEMTAVKKELKPIDIEALRRHLASFTSPPMSTEESIRLWKDDERY